jgi:hypothetical protein
MTERGLEILLNVFLVSYTTESQRQALLHAHQSDTGTSSPVSSLGYTTRTGLRLHGAAVKLHTNWSRKRNISQRVG